MNIFWPGYLGKTDTYRVYISRDSTSFLTFSTRWSNSTKLFLIQMNMKPSCCQKLPEAEKTVIATFEPTNHQLLNHLTRRQLHPSTKGNQPSTRLSTNLTAKSLLSPSESGLETKSAKSPSREGRTTYDWCEARSYETSHFFYLLNHAARTYLHMLLELLDDILQGNLQHQQYKIWEWCLQFWMNIMERPPFWESRLLRRLSK